MKQNNKWKEEFIETLLDLVNEIRSTNMKRPFWNRVAEKMKEAFPEEEFTTESLRSLYRYYRKSKPNKPAKIKAYDKSVGKITLEDRLLPRIKRRRSLPYLMDLLEVTEEEILLAYANLQAKGYVSVKLWQEGDTKYLQNVWRSKEYAEEHDFRDLVDNTHNEITFGLIGDTHFGSEYCAKDELENFYDICEARGIGTIFHTGDITEGFKSNRVETFLGNEAIGFQGQLELVKKQYPKRQGITTYFIIGNHDLWYQQLGMANIGRTISIVRPDMAYLGDEFAKVYLTDKISLALYHPNDGTSANVFYKVQRYIDNVSPEKLATINAVGHYHKMGIIKHRNVWGIYTGSFQKPSKYMSNRNLKSYVGGYIITIKLDNEGNILSIIPEYIDYDIS